MAKKVETPPKRQRGRPKGKPRSAAEIAADAKRTGRPGLTPEANAAKTVAIRFTYSEFEQFKREAEKRGMKLAVFARHCWNIAKGIHYGDDIQDTEKTN